MKNIILSLVALSIIGCTSPSTDNTSESTSIRETELIESTVLWKAKIDEVTWEPIELKKLISDEERFRPFGNFYESMGDIQAFGGRVKYIGLIGIEYVPGPNVTIDAPTQVVADYIAKKYQLEFKNEDGEYQVEIGKDLLLVVAPHTTQENVSMVIGAYLGP